MSGRRGRGLNERRRGDWPYPKPGEKRFGRVELAGNAERTATARIQRDDIGIKTNGAGRYLPERLHRHPSKGKPADFR